METGLPEVSNTILHCLPRVHGDFQSTSLALLGVRGRNKQRTRTAQSARILELRVEIDKLEFLEEFTKRAGCEVTRRTTPTDDVCMDAKRRSTFSDGLATGQLLNRLCGHQGNTSLDFSNCAQMENDRCGEQRDTCDHHTICSDSG